MVMSIQAFRSRYRVLTQAAAIALVAGLGAACSGDVTRFNKPIFKNPFAKTARNEAPAPPAGVGYADSDYKRPSNGGNSGVARYDLPPPPDYSVPRNDPPSYESNRDSAMAPPSSGEGVTVRLGYGETLSSLSRRYGVPMSAIARANGIADPSRVQAGQRIYIPGASEMRDDGGYAVASVDDSQFGRNSASRPGRTAPGPSILGTLPASPNGRLRDDMPMAASGSHVVAYGETFGGIAGRYGISRTELMEANGIADPNRIREGQRLVIPGAGVPDRRIASIDEPRGRITRDIEPGYYEDSRYPEDLPPTTSSVRRPQAPSYEQSDGPAGYTPPGSANSNLASLDPSDNGSADGQQFRWPVRGRIISGFGPKPNGERNDGINLAVPAGTSIKAAEAGTVIYSGNEIAGYGNLVLVRHAGGWVTAYAHASEVMVRRGDQVRRGQTIGYAGATGAVTTPQLHFELRRGSNPVNPMDYLAGA
jgi:murein DD-endopeptidase MepM/ murein hydrolase activator NlpD